MTTSGGDVARFRRLDRAFRDGDLAGLRAELGDRPGFPNVVAHPALGYCLVQAIYSSPPSFVVRLLDAGADPNQPVDDGFPPLIAAMSCLETAPGSPARSDALELLEVLLARGADPDQRGGGDETALHLAAALGNLAVVELLLRHGADPEAVTRVDDPVRPLELAVANGHREVAARLRTLTLRPDWEWATSTGAVDDVGRLLDQIGDLDVRDASGQTALMRAAHGGHLPVVELLVSRGADLDRTAKYGLSALMLAVVAGHHAVARRLVAAGADVALTGTGAPGFAGKTAADLAAERGDTRLARAIRGGARPRLR